MYSFNSYLHKLSEESGISFSLKCEAEGINFNSLTNETVSTFIFEVALGHNIGRISLPNNVKSCTALLKFSIENKYEELISRSENCIINFLEGKEVSADIADTNFPFITKGCILYLVSVDKNRTEVLEMIRELYEEQEVVCFLYGEYILVLGVLEEENEHAESIRDIIASNLFANSSIAYGNSFNASIYIKRAYEEAKIALFLGKRFGLNKEIYSYNAMIFERIVYGINDDLKKEILFSYKKKFDCFDNEINTTVANFIDCQMNISLAAKKLYVHRNTLIYRLDKIKKDTGLDLRLFNEAAIFIIAFLIWKEEKYKTSE
ncbi:MAG TPA: helix-turn-helix domain-containing protein [Clostridiaceae bacterium]